MGGFIIAIDGPAGAGKTTMAIALAKKLGFEYLDTGAMYRAVTLKLIEAGAIETESNWLMHLNNFRLDVSTDPSNLKVSLDGKDVTKEIRSPKVDQYVSQVAANKEIRECLKKKQRAIADQNKIVCEGRDMTTVVFPDAQLKIFLEANQRERAFRRKKQLAETGIDTDMSQIKKNISFRDRYDSNRNVAPLVKTDQAMVIDNTSLSVAEEIEIVTREVSKRLGK